MKSDLEEKLNHLENTPDATVYKSLRIAKTQLIVGNTQRAKQEASEIISKNPESEAAQQIYDLANIQEKIIQAERSQLSRDSLTEHLNNIERMSTTNNQKALRSSIIARGYSVMGDEQKVQEYHDSMKVYLNKPVKPSEYP